MDMVDILWTREQIKETKAKYVPYTESDRGLLAQFNEDLVDLAR